MDKRIVSGVNDLYTWCSNNGEYGKKLLDEWMGVDEYKNTIDISNIASSSHIKALWCCNECSNIWTTAISNRTYKKSNCPKCKATNQSILNESRYKESLYQYCNRDNPKLLNEWVGIDKNNNRVDIQKIGSASGKIVKWRCSKCGNEYNSSIKHRVLHNSGCPICHRIKNETLGDYFDTNDGKLLKLDWTGLTINRYKIDPYKVAKGSLIEVNWRCHQCNNIWSTPIYQRTRNNRHTGCPICNKHIYYTDEQNLYTWAINNSEFGKQLISEWTGLDEYGNTVEINKITRGSKLKIQWVCSKCKRKWISEINQRTYYKTGCPYCQVHNTSFSEMYLFHCFKQAYEKIEHRFICKARITDAIKTFELDILMLNNNPYIKYKAIAIEYSPTIWHKDKLDIDNIKKEICEKHNVLLIQIIDDSFKELDKLYSFNVIQDVIEKSNDRINKLNSIVTYIMSNINSSKYIDFNKALNETIIQYNAIKQ